MSWATKNVHQSETRRVNVVPDNRETLDLFHVNATLAKSARKCRKTPEPPVSRERRRRHQRVAFDCGEGVPLLISKQEEPGAAVTVVLRLHPPFAWARP